MQGIKLYLAALCAFCALPAHSDEPLSAIEWLSESLRQPTEFLIPESPVARTVLLEPITMMPLDAPSPDSIGLFSPNVTGFPRDLWGPSDSVEIITAIQNVNADKIPALVDLYRTVVLAETDPPIDSDGSVLLARIDALLALGALEDAQALIELSDTSTPELFRRWFDVALLTGHETQACAALQDRGDIAPSYQARIFCLARNGDWNAAVLTLNSAALLGQVSDENYNLMARFLDPDLFEAEDVIVPPDHPTPLVYRMYEGFGEPIPTRHLPRAFAHADLRMITGWKLRVEAAERLARVGLIPDNQLLGIYTERSPAASGGVWERVAAFQRFEAALEIQDAGAISETLPRAWLEMQTAGLEPNFANLFAPELADIPLTAGAASVAQQVALLSADYETLSQQAGGVQTAQIRFLRAVAVGQPGSVPAAQNSAFEAVQAGFDGGLPDQDDRHLLDQGRLGEAILRGITLFSDGVDGDYNQITRALRLLRFVGLEDASRRASLQFLIMESRGA